MTFRWPFRSRKQPANIRTVFFTVAVGKHRMFVLPYIYSVLRNDPSAAVEIMVDGAEEYLAKNAKALGVIGSQERVRIRNIDCDSRDANYMRFLREPETKSDYVYIGDVDILVVGENVTDVHIANSKKLGLPYSNIVRPCGTRFSGLHFTQWDAFYPLEPPPPSKMRAIGGDEQLLMQMVLGRGFAPPAGDFRPTHGIHFSLNRSEPIFGKAPVTWGATRDRWSNYLKIKAEPAWNSLLPHLAPEFRMMLETLENACSREFGFSSTTRTMDSEIS